jgi:hypothetical protein
MAYWRNSSNLAALQEISCKAGVRPLSILATLEHIAQFSQFPRLRSIARARVNAIVNQKKEA